jgi:hypothetical protein
MSSPWRVVSLLSAVSCVGYLVRADVVVAQERTVPTLGLTMTAMGAITASGNHALVYRICEVGNLTNCDQATVTIYLSGSGG